MYRLSRHFSFKLLLPTTTHSKHGGNGGSDLVTTFSGGQKAPYPIAFTACIRTLVKQNQTSPHLDRLCTVHKCQVIPKEFPADHKKDFGFIKEERRPLCSVKLLNNKQLNSSVSRSTAAAVSWPVFLNTGFAKRFHWRFSCHKHVRKRQFLFHKSSGKKLQKAQERLSTESWKDFRNY